MGNCPPYSYVPSPCRQNEALGSERPNPICPHFGDHFLPSKYFQNCSNLSRFSRFSQIFLKLFKLVYNWSYKFAQSICMTFQCCLDLRTLANYMMLKNQHYDSRSSEIFYASLITNFDFWQFQYEFLPFFSVDTYIFSNKSSLWYFRIYLVEPNSNFVK